MTDFDAGPTSQSTQPDAGPAPWAAAVGAGVAPSAAPPAAGAGPEGGSPPFSGDPPPPAAPSPPAPQAVDAPQAAAPAPSLSAAAGEAPQAAPAHGGVGPSCGCGGGQPGGGAVAAQAPPVAPPPPAAVPVGPPPDGAVAVAPVPVVAPVAPLTQVFAIGNIGFDFGTEARRDAFRQLMNPVDHGGSPPVVTAPNPYDVNQLFHYLEGKPDDPEQFPPHRYDSTKVIWTLNLDLTPIYALEAEVPYAEDAYSMIRRAMKNQALPATDRHYVSRVSIPGILTTRTRRLFSGQVIPVVVTQPRGLYIWNEDRLVEAVVHAVNPPSLGADADAVALKVRQMLDKVYYQLRNLGQSPPDRAINFQATNAFIFAESIARGLLAGSVVDGDTSRLYSLDSISAVKSPYCRVDSDCWDVQISFFDPENENRARLVLQSTIDVSDEMPVQLAPTHQFLVA